MLRTNRLQRPKSIAAIIDAEESRKLGLKKTPTSKKTTQTPSAYDNESTIIVKSQPKKEEKIIKGFEQQECVDNEVNSSILLVSYFKNRWKYLLTELVLAIVVFYFLSGYLINLGLLGFFVIYLLVVGLVLLVEFFYSTFIKN